MWNAPSKAQLQEIPRLYETEEVSQENMIVYMHFFLAGCDWYAVGYDGQDLFFGYAILHNDFDNAEWGYFSLSELQGIKIGPGVEVDHDLYWQVRPASQVDRIRVNLVRKANQGHLNS